MSDADANVTEATNQTSRKWRPRLSLLTALLVTTIAAMGIATWQMYHELVPLRREVRVLRTQLGVLTVEEDSHIYVVEVKEAGTFQWNWRVRLPEGHDFWMCSSRSVPAAGIPANPQNRTRLGVGGQEFNIRVQVVPNENGDRTVYLESPQNDSPILEVEQAKWVRGEAMLSMDVAGRESQVSSKVDEPVVLLRLREASDDAEPADGLLIWITNRRFTR